MDCVMWSRMMGTGALTLVAMASMGCTAVVDLDHLQGGGEEASTSSSSEPPPWRPDPSPVPASVPDEVPADDACANSALLGNWLAVDIKVGETLTFAEDCSGWDGHCGAAFTYAPVVETSGLVAIDVLSSQDPTCIVPGTYACSYTLLSDTLFYDCGAGEQMYARVQ